ncbi:enoyl-ACP reductase FabI [Mesoterricola sediminis]|uniref:Enoyl-[acyl-carrier-protein] reductase [NADH] n=1 Tax=Mesoterricola sediminis TaxID=2927980 RepID=A0AA48H2A9_9BACT|nr:enoyl-ACP reductase [Mesoterricola sediminis]BDU78675.1 enoyl-[acyl-carrier-protein] reductase [NADH] [Mesoterricola sediminis]
MLMKGKRGLVVGVANKWSIAWGISQRLMEEGAELAFTYQNERLGKNVRELTEGLENPILIPMDVTSDKQILMTFELLKRVWGHLDFLVHAVAYAPRAALEGSFVATTREDFRIAHDISAYSLAALCQSAQGLMGEGGSVVALSYLGSTRVVPNYNVMGVAKASLEASVRYLASDLGPQGIRVNAVSAGPIKTLASSGISGFGGMQRHHRNRAPLRRDTETAEVADATLFMLSPLSRGVTGQVLYVDGGFSIMGD